MRVERIEGWGRRGEGRGEGWTATVFTLKLVVVTVATDTHTRTHDNTLRHAVAHTSLTGRRHHRLQPNSSLWWPSSSSFTPSYFNFNFYSSASVHSVSQSNSPSYSLLSSFSAYSYLIKTEILICFQLFTHSALGNSQSVLSALSAMTRSHFEPSAQFSLRLLLAAIEQGDLEVAFSLMW